MNKQQIKECCKKLGYELKTIYGMRKVKVLNREGKVEYINVFRLKADAKEVQYPTITVSEKETIVDFDNMKDTYEEEVVEKPKSRRRRKKAADETAQ